MRLAVPVALVATCMKAASAQDGHPLAITHVTVIDATGRVPASDMTVLISGERIARLGPSARVAVPPNAEVIDGIGKFLIPGLADMHVHLGSYAEGIKALNSLDQRNVLLEALGTVRDQANKLITDIGGSEI